MGLSLYEFCRQQDKETLLQQWSARNGELTPGQVSYGSNRKVWWECDSGHQWQAPVSSRTRGKGCPFCAGRVLIPGENDLAATHAALALEWDGPRNGTLTPSQVMAGTTRKVWWLCPKGHSYQATVASRAHGGTGCPVCAGKTVVPGENDLATLFPAVAAELDTARQPGLRSDALSPFANRKVWWRCPLGHSYAALVSSRTQHQSGCPYCAGKKVLVGFNDLATVEPQVAAQWHPTLNGAMTARMLTPGSHYRAWWICAEGHVWRAATRSRTGTQRCGCPVCAGKVKADRAERYAQLQRREEVSLSGEGA